MEWEGQGLLGYPEEYYEDAVVAPVFFVDLNLDQIVAQIMDERRDYDLRRYFYRMPKELSATEKRQEVLKAFGQAELFEAAMRFSTHMQCARKFAAAYQSAESQLQQRKFLLDCGAEYVLAVEDFAQALADIIQKDTETGLLAAFAKQLCTYAETEQFRAFRAETVELAEAFEHMTFRVEFANRRMRVLPQEEEMNYLDKLRALFPENVSMGQAVRNELENPFQGEKALGELELFVLTLCQKKYPESFERLRQYEQKYSEWEIQELTQQERMREADEKVRKAAFLEAWLLEAEQQLQVYLALQLFMRKIKKADYPLAYAEFCKPEEKDRAGLHEPEGESGGRNLCKLVGENNADLRGDSIVSLRDGAGSRFGGTKDMLRICNCYDLALLLKQIYYQKPVVCNDAYYEGKERFLVVTGPNQGGKTTFARSLGQIVYFAKMGFAAPCSYAYMPYFDGLLTHFSVEESLETGRGKLKEELVRLEPMMHKEKGNSFVILNELFTTAATYDAYIMGRRVMEHFMEQGCYGVYVTHIQELASDGGEAEAEEMGLNEEDAAPPMGEAAKATPTERTAKKGMNPEMENVAPSTEETIGKDMNLEIGNIVPPAEETAKKGMNLETGNVAPLMEASANKDMSIGVEPSDMTGRIVSMAACVDEKDAHIRTYRIVRRKAEGVGYAYGLVEKYHLTYPELKERIGKQLKAGKAQE